MAIKLLIHLNGSYSLSIAIGLVISIDFLFSFDFNSLNFSIDFLQRQHRYRNHVKQIFLGDYGSISWSIDK